MMVPAVALVSAPRMTPSLNFTPTMVVPVDVCRGSLKPFWVRERFLVGYVSMDKLAKTGVPLVIVKLEACLRVTNRSHALNNLLVNQDTYISLPRNLADFQKGSGLGSICMSNYLRV